MWSPRKNARTLAKASLFSSYALKHIMRDVKTITIIDPNGNKIIGIVGSVTIHQLQTNSLLKDVDTRLEVLYHSTL